MKVEWIREGNIERMFSDGTQYAYVIDELTQNGYIMGIRQPNGSWQKIPYNGEFSWAKSWCYVEVEFMLKKDSLMRKREKLLNFLHPSFVEVLS